MRLPSAPRFRFIDVLRVIAVAGVLYTHIFALPGTARALPEAISHDRAMPFFSAPTHWLWGGNTLALHFETLPAIFGVTLFFIITGYLMADMFTRYNRAGFAVTRFFRLWPALVASLAVVGIFVALTQGIYSTPIQYLTSALLIHEPLGVVPVISLLWTLVVEGVFYLVCLLFGGFDYKRMWVVAGCCVAGITLWHLFPTHLPLKFVAIYAQPMLVILIGTAIYLSASDKENSGATIVIAMIALAYFGYRMTGAARTVSAEYYSGGTLLLAPLLFLLFQQWEGSPLLNTIHRALRPLAEIVYPTYLLNVAIGIGTISLVRSLTASTLVMTASGLIATIVAAYVVHVCVERPFIGIGRSIARRVGGRRAPPVAAALGQDMGAQGAPGP